MSGYDFSPSFFNYLIIIVLGVIIAVGVFWILESGNFNFLEQKNETNESLQPSFNEVYVFCNQELYNYTFTNQDYLQCSTQDECDLKTLRYNLLIQRNYECFEYFWELKD